MSAPPEWIQEEQVGLPAAIYAPRDPAVRDPRHDGEKDPRTKLSDLQLREIRVVDAAGSTPARPSADYGITRASATQNVTGQTRAVAGEQIRSSRPSAVRGGDQVGVINLLYRQGGIQAQVARLGVMQGRLWDLTSGKKRPAFSGPGGT